MFFQIYFYLSLIIQNLSANIFSQLLFIRYVYSMKYDLNQYNFYIFHISKFASLTLFLICVVSSTNYNFIYIFIYILFYLSIYKYGV